MKYNIDELKAIKLSLICNKLKNSLTETKILQWLDNFEEDEQEDFIDLLLLYEYITTEEIIESFNTNLEKIFTNNNYDEFYINPIGDYGKSATSMIYYIKRIIKDNKKKQNIKIYPSIKSLPNNKNLQQSKNSHQSKSIAIILIDDFFGSGNSAINYFNNKVKQQCKIIENRGIKINVFFVAIVALEQAEKNIEREVINSTVYASMNRNKIFEEETLFVNKDSKEKIKENCLKYGQNIYRKFPLGYDDSQSLISFSHGTPNNTLPIFWSDTNMWKPIFPRFINSKMSKARKDRKEIAYLLSLTLIFNLGEFEMRNNKGKLLKIKTKFSVLAIIKLLYEKNDKNIICQKLGIFNDDYDRYIEISKKHGFINKEGTELTFKGRNVLYRIEQEKKNINYDIMSEKELKFHESKYLPDNFRGVSKYV